MSEKQIYNFFLLSLAWFTKLSLGCALLNIFIKLLRLQTETKENPTLGYSWATPVKLARSTVGVNEHFQPQMELCQPPPAWFVCSIASDSWVWLVLLEQAGKGEDKIYFTSTFRVIFLCDRSVCIFISAFSTVQLLLLEPTEKWYKQILSGCQLM